MSKLVECVPNFSEGRDAAVSRSIAAEIEAVRGVTLLDVDPGEDSNRTVVTFVGPPEAVVEAASRAGKRAAETIDMTRHHGSHARMRWRPGNRSENARRSPVPWADNPLWP